MFDIANYSTQVSFEFGREILKYLPLSIYLDSLKIISPIFLS